MTNASGVDAAESPPARALLLRSKFARDAAGMGALHVAWAGLAYFTQLLFARWLGAADYGIYAYVTTVTFLVSGVGALGLPQAALRFLPRDAGGESEVRPSSYLRFARRRVLVGSMVAVALSGVAYLALDSIFPLSGPQALLASALIPLQSILLLEMESLRASGSVASAYLPSRIFRNIVHSIVGFVLLTLGLMSVISLLLSLTAIVAIELMVQRYQASRVWNLSESPIGVPSAPVWEVAIPLLVSGSLALAITRVDVLILGAFAPADEIGIYSAVSKTAALVTFAYLAVDSFLSPRISALYRAGDLVRLESECKHASRIVFWLTFGFFLFIGLGGESFLRLFGRDFETGFIPLLVLAAANLVRVGFGPVTPIASFAGMQTHAVGILAMAVGVNVALAILLIPPFGITGAAVSTAAAILVWHMMLYMLVNRRLGISPGIFGLRRRTGGVRRDTI